MAEQNTPQVMIVDRERLAQLIAKMLEENFAPNTVPHGMWAFTKMRKAAPDLVLVDTDVPGNGIRLAELVGVSPELNTLPLILMSANTTQDLVVRSRNAGADAFLAKPFAPRQLLDRIDAVLAKHAQRDGKTETGTDEDAHSSSLLERVKSIEGLPSFPTTHAEILKLAKSENTSSDQIAEKIQLDPSFLATIFKLVNSPYYGFRRKVDSLSLAVTLLGLEEIANLVMAAQVFEKLGNYEGGADLDLEAFWKHTVGTAFIARAIGKELKLKIESAFLAGMLHDLGKIILDRFFADYYAEVLKMAQDKGLTLYAAEKEVLGVGHTEIGGQLAKEWQFADAYLHTILYHHKPLAATANQILVSLVHLSDILCQHLDFGSSGSSAFPEIEIRALECLGIGDSHLEPLAELAKNQLEDADAFLAALGN